MEKEGKWTRIMVTVIKRAYQPRQEKQHELQSREVRDEQTLGAV